jgi:two-component system sensor histidine kinase FlrB
VNCENNTSGKQLEDAFSYFNQISEKLSLSYSTLQTQVAHLSTELAHARNERLKQLAEKETLARRLEGLLDTLPAGIVVLDAQGCITQTNPVANDMLGNALTGKCWQALAQQAFVVEADELRLHDGRWVNVSVRPLVAEPGRIILITDITETRRLQDTVNRQQRLTSLGEMAAGLAHQIRTPLSSALLYLSNLMHPSAGADDRRRFTEKATERLHHLDRMVNDMLIFVRGGVSASEYFDAGVLAKELQQILEPQFTAGRFTLDIDDGVHAATLRGNRDALLGAMQNIANNAREACDAAPELSIRVRHCGDERIEFSFNDNGHGMPDAIRERILEPFFTTRASGTGLGMAVVNATVTAYGGDIDIVSDGHTGSCITISLPLAQQLHLLPSNLADHGNRFSDLSLHRRKKQPDPTFILHSKEAIS